MQDKQFNKLLSVAASLMRIAQCDNQAKKQVEIVYFNG